MSRWLSLSEAAKWVQDEFERAGRSISRKTVSRWARDGRIRAEQREQRWYVEPESLREFVRRELEREPTNDESDEERLRTLRERVRAKNTRFLRDLANGID